MAEYINREDAKNALTGWDTDPTDEAIEYALDNIPTADVVEVVRCKDCVNFKSTSNPKYCYKHIDDWGNGEIYTDEDDYCSYGERRSE